MSTPFSSEPSHLGPRVKVPPARITLPILAVLAYTAFLLTGFGTGLGRYQPVPIYAFFGLLLLTLQVIIAENRSIARLSYTLLATLGTLTYAALLSFGGVGGLLQDPLFYGIINILLLLGFVYTVIDRHRMEARQWRQLAIYGPRISTFSLNTFVIDFAGLAVLCYILFGLFRFLGSPSAHTLLGGTAASPCGGVVCTDFTATFGFSLGNITDLALLNFSIALIATGVSLLFLGIIGVLEIGSSGVSGQEVASGSFATFGAMLRRLVAVISNEILLSLRFVLAPLIGLIPAFSIAVLSQTITDDLNNSAALSGATLVDLFNPFVSPAAYGAIFIGLGLGLLAVAAVILSVVISETDAAIIARTLQILGIAGRTLGITAFFFAFSLASINAILVLINGTQAVPFRTGPATLVALVLAGTGVTYGLIERNVEVARFQRKQRSEVLERKVVASDFDVLLCYNAEDRAAVERIATDLRTSGILPWLDVWELQPGMRLQSQLERQVRRIKAAAVFIGAGGSGPWQRDEMDSFLQTFVERGCPVIPVQLPGNVSTPPNMPPYLKDVSWIDLRQSGKVPLQQLITAITGETAETRYLEDAIAVNDIRLAMDNAALKDATPVARQLFQRLGLQSPELESAKGVIPGCLWMVTLPDTGLQLPREASVLVRTVTQTQADFMRLNAHQQAGDECFLIVDLASALPLPEFPPDTVAPIIRLGFADIQAMLDLPKQAVNNWLKRAISRQVKRANLYPFRTEGASKLFFGRTEELRRLMGGDARGGLIIGAHRSGKSTLLKKLEEEWRRRGRPVVGTMIPTVQDDFQSFYERTLDALGVAIPMNMNAESWALAVQRHTQASQQRPVFLLDEVDGLLELDERTGFFLGRQMRALKEDSFADFYMAGHARLRRAIAREEDPLRNFAEEVILTGLEESAGLGLIQDPMRRLGYLIDDEQAQRIYRGTAGVAWLIQKFCLNLLQRESDDIDDEGIAAIEQDPAYLTAVWEHYLYGQRALSRAIMLMTAMHGEVTRQKLLDACMQQDLVVTRQHLDVALDFLTKFGVLREYPPGQFRLLSGYLHDAILAREPVTLLREDLATVKKEGVA